MPGVTSDTTVALAPAWLAPNVKVLLLATPWLMTVILAWLVNAVISPWPGVLTKPPVMVALEVRLAARALAPAVRSMDVSGGAASPVGGVSSPAGMPPGGGLP